IPPACSIGWAGSSPRSQSRPIHEAVRCCGPGRSSRHQDRGWCGRWKAGVSPPEASSGKITRHRLNRFGDRQLNRALHVIVNWRMLHYHDQTQAYLTRRAGYKPNAKSAGASNATPPAACSASWRQPPGLDNP
ncbi:MAG: transposase, partial [Mycobacterium sp.]|nr:transposase [Mycobacterium sp.]